MTVHPGQLWAVTPNAGDALGKQLAAAGRLQLCPLTGKFLVIRADPSIAEGHPASHQKVAMPFTDSFIISQFIYQFMAKNAFSFTDLRNLITIF